jgi:beta-galactosidase
MGKFAWTVPFKAGEIKAIARDKSGKEYEDVLYTTNKACKLDARLIDEAAMADGISILQIEVDALDDRGAIAESAEIPVTIETEGEVVYEHMDNGNLRDISDYTSNVRNTHHGRLMVYVRTTDKMGKAKVDIKNSLGDIELEFETK